MVAVLIHENKLSEAGAGSDSNFRPRPGALGCAPRFVGRAFCLELVFEFVHETEHRPGAGFTKGADGPALNVFGDVEQVLGVLGASVTLGEAMERLAHPERPFAAGGALATAL